jgi:hypothetical protein
MAASVIDDWHKTPFRFGQVAHDLKAGGIGMQLANRTTAP